MDEFYLILIMIWLITAYFQIRALLNLIYIWRMHKKEDLIHVLEQKSKVTDNKDGTYTHTFE